MRILNYWVATRVGGPTTANIRATSKKIILAGFATQNLKQHRSTKNGHTWRNDADEPIYTHPHKVTVEFENPLELVNKCLGPNGALIEVYVETAEADEATPETTAEDTVPATETASTAALASA